MSQHLDTLTCILVDTRADVRLSLSEGQLKRCCVPYFLDSNKADGDS